MSDSERRHRHMAKPSKSRRGLRPLLVFVALVAVAVALTPTGSAKPPASNNKSYSLCLQGTGDTGTFCQTPSNQSHLSAGSTTQMTLTISNAPTSPSTLGSMNFDAPSGVTMTSATSPASPAGDVTLIPNGGVNGTGELQIRNLNLAAGSNATVAFNVSAPCAGGPFTWPTPATKQSNDFNGTGNDFNAPTSFAGKTSVLGGVGCYLGFVTQPADTQVGHTITDAIASSGGAIKVGLFNGDGNPMTTCPVAAASCKVTVSTNPTAAGFTGTTSQPLLADTNGNLVASFGDLAIGGIAIANLPKTFTLHASSTFTNAAPHGEDTSDPFEIEESLVDCSSGCSVTNLPLGGSGDSVLDFSTTSNYGFVALNPFSFVPNNIPQGCANFMPLSTTPGLRTPVSGFSESSPVVGGGMTITYYVSQNAIKARYGKNVGQQFIPICAGAMPVVNGTPTPCDQAEGVQGWTDDTLDANGFTGLYSQAVCDGNPLDPGYGFFWGILPSFQDVQKMTSAQLATLGPFVTNWSSSTINGITYRFFTMSVPGDWDYKGGG